MNARRILGPALLAGLLALVAGCAVRAPGLTATPNSASPLQASIFPPYYGQVPVALNKPAYVALFEVIPGRGASMLYPKYGSGFTQVRDNWIPLDYSAQRWLYASNGMGTAVGQWSGFDYGYGVGYGLSSRSLQGAGAPRYLFLVASETPISTDRFQGSASSVRQYLGNNMYSSYQPYDVMERLAYALAPYDATDDSWVTDVFVDWGYDWGYGYTPGTSALAASWQPILCSDGSVGFGRWVPGWGYDNFSCMPMQRREGTPGWPTYPGQPGGNPADSGRSRIRTPGAPEGRDRIRPVPNGSQVAPRSAEEIRSRIAQLRDDANRARFAPELNEQLRRGVELRHRADYLMGRGGADAVAGRNGSSSARSANRSREARARAERDLNAGRAAASRPAPRSREARPAPAPRPSAQPRSTPSAGSAPRSRQPAPTPASSPTPRSRPDR